MQHPTEAALKSMAWNERMNSNTAGSGFQVSLTAEPAERTHVAPYYDPSL